MNKPLHPADELAAIVGHYLRTLTELSGKRWTDANTRDVERIATLIEQLTTTTNEPETDTMPAYQPPAPPQLETRVTQVLERESEPGPSFQRRRTRQYAGDDYDIAKRILRREERAR